MAVWEDTDNFHTDAPYVYVQDVNVYEWSLCVNDEWSGWMSMITSTLIAFKHWTGHGTGYVFLFEQKWVEANKNIKYDFVLGFVILSFPLATLHPSHETIHIFFVRYGHSRLHGPCIR